jgi:hypothetical protein
MTNKYLLFLILLISYFSHFAQNKNTIKEKKEIKKENLLEPTDIIQQQLNAYNTRDLEAFLKPYDDNIEAYLYPDNKLAFKGKEAMRKIYSEIFKNTPNLHCELINRLTQGNKIIDKERIQFGDDVLEVVVIYYIVNNKIAKVHFIN